MSLLKKAVVLASLLSSILAIAQNIPASEANRHIGEQATVCGKVAETHTASTARGIPTFVDFEKAYPNQTFTAVVWQRDKSSVGRLPKAGTLCVSGTITTYHEHPQIVVHSSSDWSVPACHVSPSRCSPIPAAESVVHGAHHLHARCDSTLADSVPYVPLPSVRSWFPYSRSYYLFICYSPLVIRHQQATQADAKWFR
jgi:hypothetical protein